MRIPPLIKTALTAGSSMVISQAESDPK
jgi:hypothetical protein